jgi:hypothetical protein
VRLCPHEDGSTARAGNGGRPCGAVVGFLLLGPGALGTPPRAQNTIEQALTCFVADRFGAAYVGRCPGSSRRTATSIGVCAPRGSLARTAGSCIAWAIRSVSGSGRPCSSAMHPDPGMWRASRSIHPSPDGGEGGGRYTRLTPRSSTETATLQSLMNADRVEFLG